MVHHFSCPPNAETWVHREPLVIDWDDKAGTVTGPGAEAVYALLRHGVVEVGNWPRASWPVSEASLKSRTDMAVIIGSAWQVPPELCDAFPDLSPRGQTRVDAGRLTT